VTVVERMTKEVVQYGVSGKVATIALNRPEAANAHNAELLPELDLRWTAAAYDAMFSDPLALMGIGGVEYHVHTSITTVIFDRPSQNLEWTGSRSRWARASWPRAK
jgi:hypothetical protein